MSAYLASSSLATRVPRWAAPAAVGGLAAATCLAARMVDPYSADLYPVCPFLALTGRLCPGCGTGRALRHLVTGDPLGAIALNPLTVLVLGPFLVWRYLAWALPRVGGPALPRAAPSALRSWALVVLVAGFWVLRNVPVAPLTLLAP